MTHALPLLIAGQGLAGTAVAWQLWQRGVPFVIVDPNLEQTCSKVAAGLITPITGMRLNPSWRATELLPEAKSYYQLLESRLNARFYHPLPHTRLFHEQREIDLWQKKREKSEISQFVEREHDLVDETVFHTEKGGFRQCHSGWLDTATYLEASRIFFTNHGCWREGDVLEKDIQIQADKEGVAWQGERFSHLILCRGWQQEDSHWFNWLPFHSAKGIISQLQADLSCSEIVNRKAWLLPHENGLFRAGSTYEFDFNRPVEASLEDLHAKLTCLLKVPFQLTQVKAGIRPIVKRLPAVIGRHPAHPQLAILNGLGSKGAMKSPALSRQLVSHLLDGVAIEASLDVRANF